MQFHRKAAIIAVALLGWASAAPATEAPSTDDLVQALTPGKTPKFRGLRVSNAPQSTGTADRPAVALDIHFNLNSADLTADTQEVVQRLAAALNSQQLAQYHFRVEGHTDASGGDDFDMALSQKRAETVKQTLIASYHVAPARLEAVGLGKSKPLDPGDPMNAQNRRVQVVNIGG